MSSLFSGQNHKPTFNARLIRVLKSKKLLHHIKLLLMKYLFISLIQTIHIYLKIYLTGRQKFPMSQLNQGLQKKITIEPDLSDERVMRIAAAYILTKKQAKKTGSKWINKGEWEGIIARSFSEFDAAIKNNNTDQIRMLLQDFARTKLSMGLSLVGSLPTNFQEKVQLLNSYNLTFDTWKTMTNSSLDQISVPFAAGNPIGIEHGPAAILVPSFRHNYYAEKISSLLADKPEPLILEIGGGYGGVAMQLMKNTKNKCKIISVDLPELCAVSAYALMQACPEKNVLLYGETDFSTEAINKADVIIIPPFAIEELRDNSVSLVFNAHSFTEMGYSTVKNYLYEIDRICSKYLLHENHERNTTYLTLQGTENQFVNMNSAEFEPCKKNWKKTYRKPEVIQNCLPWAGEYFEYLFTKN